MRQKLELQTEEAEDAKLIRTLLDWMQKSRADFTNTFRDLSSEGPPTADRSRDADFRVWYARWQDRLGPDGRPVAATYAAMRAVNPAVIPRDHRVAEALSAAEDHDDLSVLHRLLAALASPYEAGADPTRDQEPPPDDCHYRTFSGT
jgi:serine/tyrosine/threonine adenylyltransferase